jgi:hypothetical protein
MSHMQGQTIVGQKNGWMNNGASERIGVAINIPLIYMIPFKPRNPPDLEDFFLSSFSSALSLTFLPMFWAPPGKDH